jgi:hypothetical protein
VTTHERLLITCTRPLLEGWTGPVHGYVHRGIPTLAVSIGDFTPEGLAILWTQMGDGYASPSSLSLDLSRAECRDRHDRIVTPMVESRSDIAEVRARALRTLLTWHGLDPDGDDDPPMAEVLLPDGSRLVDALALAAVWREVSR